MPWPFSTGAALTMINLDSEDSQVKCEGIVTFTVNDRTGGKLGGIVPSYFFVEAINKIESK
jgi:hypothetical protein